MDRLHVLRDTANLPRAVAPPICSSGCRGQQSMNDSGLDMRMDDSLTDMLWLQRMDAGSEIPGFVQKVMRKRLKSERENQRPNKDGCRKRLNYGSEGREGEKPPTNKPPLSYASLIVLAISSTPQRMLTLSGIYRWIESTFPFYRTPESKAWKNSIRHNLSIRKNMFVKVYQLPPRRGNGSYWTLLSDGEEELKKAHPLFTTLLPPVIDEDSAYYHVPHTHTVRSSGQFMPVLPHTTRKTPYFALDSSTTGDSTDVSVTNSSLLSPQDTRESERVTATKSSNKRKRAASFSSTKSSTLTSPNTPTHLAEHSYAKSLTFEPELQQVEEELAPEDMVEGSFILEPSDTFGGCESKRQCFGQDDQNTCESGKSGTTSYAASANLQVGGCDSTTDDVIGGDAHSLGVCTTPGRSDSDDDSAADFSLSSLLGSSFLTPIKMGAMADLTLDAISFSPLYNFVTPQREGTTPKRPSHHTTNITPSPLHSTHNTSTATGAVRASPHNVCSTISPSTVGGEEENVNVPLSSTSTASGGGVLGFDSGVFSPFTSSLHFSTPLMKGVSPLVDLPGNVFNTPQSSERVSTPVRATLQRSVTTPTRKTGSRQLFMPPTTHL